MNEYEKASKVLDALKSAQGLPAPAALPILNSLVGLVQGDEQVLEVADARASAFMAICELGKALHRGQPAGDVWAAATSATERWLAMAK